MSVLNKTYEELHLDALQHVHSTRTHDVYICPYCVSKKGTPDTDGKFYFSLKKEIGWCFRCKTVGIPYDENRTKDEATFLLKQLSRTFQETLNLNETLGNLEESLSDLPIINFDEYFLPLDTSATDYLESRHPLLPELAGSLNIRCNEKGVIFPFYYRKNVVKYQLRYYNNPKMKYYTSIGPKLMYSPHRIFDDPSLRVSEVTIVEGTFDTIGALLLGYPNPLAILGSSITELNIRLLRSLMPSVINIFMDDVDISYSIRNELKKRIPSCEKFNVIRSYGDDPEEIFLKSLLNSSDLNPIIKRVTEFNDKISGRSVPGMFN